MKKLLLAMIPVPVLFILAGCSGTATDKHEAHSATSADQPDKEADIRASLAELSPEDRQLAEAQKFCVVQADSRLGSMGKPVKLTIKDSVVFVCCKSCVRKAEADPDKTLARLAELKKGVGR